MFCWKRHISQVEGKNEYCFRHDYNGVKLSRCRMVCADQRSKSVNFCPCPPVPLPQRGPPGTLLVSPARSRPSSLGPSVPPFLSPRWRTSLPPFRPSSTPRPLSGTPAPHPPLPYLRCHPLQGLPLWDLLVPPPLPLFVFAVCVPGFPCKLAAGLIRSGLAAV